MDNTNNNEAKTKIYRKTTPELKDDAGNITPTATTYYSDKCDGTIIEEHTENPANTYEDCQTGGRRRRSKKSKKSKKTKKTKKSKKAKKTKKSRKH
jgi:hypothetical protein